MKQLLKRNLIIGTAAKIFAALPPSFRRHSFKVLALLLLNSILDVFGLAAMVPLILILLEENAIENSYYLSNLYEMTGLESTDYFLFALCAAVGIVVILKNVLSLFIYRYQALFSFGLMNYFSFHLLRYYYDKGFTFFKNTNSNVVIRNVTGVPLQFSNNVVLPMITFFTESVVLLVIFGVILIVDPTIIVLLAVIIGPAFFYFYRYAKNRVKQLNEDIHELIPKMGKNGFQSIFGYVDAKITNSEDSFFQKHKEILGTMRMLRSSDFVFKMAPTKVIETALICGLLVLVVYGVVWVDDRSHLLQLLSIFGVAAFRATPSINRLMIALISIKGNQYTFDIINLVKDPLPENEQEQIVPMPFEKEIRFEDLKFQYDNTDSAVIGGISFKVDKGEKIGIVGKSGSGKSTLINILLRFLKEQEGAIFVDGQPLNDDNVQNWRKRIGYVQQEVYILDTSLEENIAFGSREEEIDKEKLWEVIRKASLEDLVLNLPEKEKTIIGERGTRISGGQKQRIGIARALYGGASVLVLDEATSALDSETEEEITESIRNLADMNLTMFIIAHRITTLRYCDRIIRMDSGFIDGIFQYHELMEETQQ